MDADKRREMYYQMYLAKPEPIPVQAPQQSEDLIPTKDPGINHRKNEKRARQKSSGSTEAGASQK